MKWLAQGHTAGQRHNQKSCLYGNALLILLYHTCLSTLCWEFGITVILEQYTNATAFSLGPQEASYGWGGRGRVGNEEQELGFYLPGDPEGISISLILMLFWSNFEELSSLHFWARHIRLHYPISLAV